jgi:hypothetical protein
MRCLIEIERWFRTNDCSFGVHSSCHVTIQRQRPSRDLTPECRLWSIGHRLPRVVRYACPVTDKHSLDQMDFGNCEMQGQKRAYCY